MAGLFDAFARGYGAAQADRRERADREEAQKERANRRERRTVLEGREDTTFQQGQEDRTRTLEQGAEDRQYELGVKRPAERQRLAREQRVGDYKEARLPVEDAQNDAKYAFQMKGEQQKLRMGEVQLELAQYGLDQRRMEAEVQHAQKQFTPALREYVRTKDPRVFAAWANAGVTQHDPITIEQDQQGQWFMQSRSGERQMLGSADNVMIAARALTNPNAYLESTLSQLQRQREQQDKLLQAQAENPQRFTELVNDDRGAMHLVDTRTGASRPVMRDEGTAPMVGTKSGAFGSRAGEMTLGARRPGAATTPAPVFQVTEGGSAPPTPAARAEATRLSTMRNAPPAAPGAAARPAAAPAAPAQPAPAARPQVPQAAIEYLRANPNLAAQFDAKYGQGAAQAYLNQGQ